ncbi:MAG TPA: decarboxylating 6-phosphogluconate dehydrogenase [Caulobacteraceae bacterium]|jgi:6-phosphogluconate dehydrogenase|nr:decarboxylating 6-phosphogluconate dehydrogenase [Caulobacteraceae bacterium]
MQLGVVGLGRMGANIARRLMRDGHQCVVWDRDAAAGETLAGEGASPAKDLAGVVAALEKPRAVWVMLPAGDPTDSTIMQLGDLLERGDVVLDGGNSFYRDDIRRAKALKAKGVDYVDVGTSGGVWGLERGYCLMIGGDDQAVKRLDPIFASLAPGLGDIDRTRRPAGADPRPEQGYAHMGPVGAGHFVKMVHNGIEYGLMQAYAEGLDILKAREGEGVAADERYDLDLASIAEVWRRGSVIASWLLDLAAQALADDASLSDYEGVVADSGEGRWTVEAAVDTSVPADVLTAALYARFRSRQIHTFGEKLLSAMRHGFGGHIEEHA